MIHGALFIHTQKVLAEATAIDRRLQSSLGYKGFVRCVSSNCERVHMQA